MTPAPELRHSLAQGPLQVTFGGRTRCKRALWSGRASRLSTLRERGSRTRIRARRRELSHAAREFRASRACSYKRPVCPCSESSATRTADPSTGCAWYACWRRWVLQLWNLRMT